MLYMYAGIFTNKNSPPLFSPSSLTISQTKHTPPYFSNKFIFVRQTTQALFHIAKSLIAILGALFFPTTKGFHSISKYTHIPIRSLLFAKKPQTYYSIWKCHFISSSKPILLHHSLSINFQSWPSKQHKVLEILAHCDDKFP